MKPVRKSAERKFLSGLKKVFGGFTDGVKSGKVTAKNIWEQVSVFVSALNVNKRADEVVSNMVKAERESSARDWREHILKNSNGPEMYEAIQKELQGPVGERMQQIIAENARYIKTVPEDWAAYITAYTERETRKGKRPEEIEEELRKLMPQHITANLKLIARTECAKAHAALTQARAENLGIRAYIWHSCRDERTRHSHAGMEGVMVFYNDPPNPEALFPYKGSRPYGNYHAGNTFNCRCYQEPVVSLNLLPDSVKVHMHGSIETMNKRQIKRRFGKIA